MKRRLDNFYISIVVIILAIPFIWMYAFISTLNSDHEMRILMTEVRQKDAEIAVYLLRSRSHIDNDFDQLGQAQKNMAKTMSAFNDKFIELIDIENEQARKIYKSYEESISKLERFKTLHAKLSNSLRFLPKLGKKLRETFEQDKSAHNHEIVELEEKILISTFSLRLFDDESLLNKINSSVESLKSIKLQEIDKAKSMLLTSFIHHAEMFILFRKKEEQVVKSILANSFESELSTLEQQMRRRHITEDKLATKTRYYLIGYSAFLFCIILLFILNRQRLLERVTTHQMLSEKDELTGLSNRRHFIHKIKNAIQTAVQGQCYGAIIFIDLDGFKEVNDGLGHNEGDEVLKKISHRLKNQSRLSANINVKQFVARLGGDEFVILLEGVNKESVKEALNTVTEKTLDNCSRSLGEKYNKFSITASIGVVTFPDQSIDVTDLLHFADLAMYKSKKQGKNCCNFHNETP